MSAVKEKTKSRRSKKQRVLVVDDDLVICRFMEKVVSDAGFEFQTVQDGLSALDIIRAYRPHFLFLDIVLPDVDGKRLCRIIRQKNEGKSIFIAILSGILMEERPDIVDLGADALIAKGPLAEMADHVERVLKDPQGVKESCLKGEILGTDTVVPRKMTVELLSSNRHFGLLLQNMRQGIVELNDDGRILFVNGAGGSFFEKKENHLVGSLFISLIPEDQQARVAELTSPDSKISSIPDSDPLFMHNRFFALESLKCASERGNVTLIMTDVTRMKREADALKEEEDRLSHIINGFTDAIILADTDGFVQMVNPAAERMFGRDKDAFIGSPFGFPLVAGETSELDIISKDRTPRVGEMRTAEIQWKNETACLASIRDITARKKMEEDLRRANEKILEQQEKLIEEERLKVLLQMSGATAHELNQPLSVLLSNIDLMRGAGENPEEIALCMTEIEKSGRRIAETIKKIQNIRHFETRSYGSRGRIVNIQQQLHVLSLEDADEDYAEIQSVLGAIDGIRLSRARTIEEGLRMVDEFSPDLVLLEYLLSGGDGFDFIRSVKAAGKDIPLVVLTSQGNEMVATRLIQEGADDYMPKSRFDRESIAACIRNVMEKGKLKREIRSAHRRISEMATLDELTGLFNRRYFMEALERERARAERHEKPLSVCMMDLDHFKRVNDRMGHGAGDLVLANIGKIIRDWARQTDLPCRYGGEEFAVILPETDVEGARIACERLRNRVAENRVHWRTGPIQITISIGIAANRPGSGDSIRKMIDRADGALYRAKKAGRNCVAV